MSRPEVYYGKVCAEHPELKGERYRSSRACTGTHRSKDTANTYAVRANRKRKQTVIDAYGGKCALCTEDDFDVLTLDHIAQDGAAHRKRLGFRGGNEIYTWAIHHEFPSTMRLLCSNCNIKAYRQFQRNSRAPNNS